MVFFQNINEDNLMLMNNSGGKRVAKNGRQGKVVSIQHSQAIHHARSNAYKTALQRQNPDAKQTEDEIKVKWGGERNC